MLGNLLPLLERVLVSLYSKFSLFVLRHRGALCSLGWSVTHCVFYIGFEFMAILLPQPPDYCDDKYELPCPAC